MYPTKIENSLVKSLDMEIGIVDDNPIKEKSRWNAKYKIRTLLRPITHIFGTINTKTNYINF